jgi:hypothetical protein
MDDEAFPTGNGEVSITLVPAGGSSDSIPCIDTMMSVAANRLVIAVDVFARCFEAGFDCTTL